MIRTFYLPGSTRYAGYFTPYAPYLIDMISGNHTLIAGTTGAGKSTLENSIIKALLACKYPGADDNGQNALLILLDPKRVELRLFKDIPHCLLYADTIPDILNGLYSIKTLIDNRLSRMIKEGRRKSAEAPVYVFIDEIVDLVTSPQGKEITRVISDTISISRACNVFYILCTQAPNRKILKPEIILNCNCRVALHCNSPIESRQIIGDDSAINLPKHGLAIVHQDLERYQIKIPIYSDLELEYLARAWSEQKPGRLFTGKQNKTGGFWEKLKKAISALFK